MRRLMIPLDGSAFAESALPYLVTVAQGPTPYVIDLVGVEALTHTERAPTAGRGVAHDAEPDASLEERQDLTLAPYLSVVAARMREVLPSTQFNTIVREGQTAEELAMHARDAQPDCIVLATHGRGGWDRLWSGSVTEHLLQHVASPVLVVRSAPAPLNYLALTSTALPTALVTVDGAMHPDECIAALDTLLGHQLNEITVLHVTPPPPRALGLVLENEHVKALALRHAREAAHLLELVATSVPAGGHRVVRVVREGADPAKTILDYVDTHGTHVMTLASTPRGAMERLLVGSVADTLLNRARVPILFVPRVAAGH